MIELKNKRYIGSDDRVSVYDISIPKAAKALIIFAHGFKGYKDWGAWHLVEKFFVSNDYGFLKFNFSHNGGTVENPIDFPDLKAFGMDNYSKELFDLNKITSLAEHILAEVKLEIPIFLIGHSRGGGVAILHGANDNRIAKLVSLAGISNIETRFLQGEELDDWKQLGTYFIKNGRTNQDMPQDYSIYENYLENKENLNIEAACEKMKKPFLQVHGDMDLVVSISEGLNVSKWTKTRVQIIKGAGHTFQTKHPWEEDELPTDMQEAVEAILSFFETNDS